MSNKKTFSTAQYKTDNQNQGKKKKNKKQRLPRVTISEAAKTIFNGRYYCVGDDNNDNLHVARMQEEEA